jgi:hypothetical protein
MTSALRVILASLTVALLLSGCMGNVVTISGQGYMSGTKSKTLDCGGSGQLSSGNQGSGKLSVTVLDGTDTVVYQNGDYGAGQSGSSNTVNGAPGEWTLRVSTGIGYVGQWAVTLAC